MALADWRDRAEYHCRRLEQFHAREFQGQSTLKVVLHAQPVVSQLTTAELRRGNGDAIFFKTLKVVEQRLDRGENSRDGFPILLVLSEIYWRPLDDFYRLGPKDGKLVLSFPEKRYAVLLGRIPHKRAGSGSGSQTPRQGD